MKSARYHLYCALYLGAVVYVGVSKNVQNRAIEHKRAKGIFGQFLREVGDVVEFKTVVIGPRSYIYGLEVKLIKVLGVRQRGVGFNLSSGGIGGRDPHPSTREKISKIVRARPAWMTQKWAQAGREAQKGKPPKPVSQETRAKISAAGRGRKLTPENKAILIEARRKVPMSDEARRKLIERNKSRVYSEEYRAKSAANMAAYNRSRKGIPLPMEQCLRISQLHSGRKVSEETRAKMRAAAYETWRRRRRGEFDNLDQGE